MVNTDTSNQFSYRFSTKPRDVETGLYYYGYRYYDPVTGRWISRDPIQERGGVNLYGFVRNDGIDRWDILGRAEDKCKCPCEDPGVKAKMAGASAGGVVVCCNGKKYHCSSSGESTVDPYEALKGKKAGYTLAKSLINKCSQDHEKTHDDDTEECKKDGAPEIAGWKDGIGKEERQKQEQIGAKTELTCLGNSLVECKGDQDCESMLKTRAQAVYKFYKENGGTDEGLK